MQEGLNVNLVLSSANLIGLIGIFVKLYMSKQPKKIEQPIEIKRADEVTDKLCDERHKDIKAQLDNIFIERNENRAIVAGLKATVDAQGRQLSSMDQKLDILLKRK